MRQINFGQYPQFVEDLRKIFEKPEAMTRFAGMNMSEIFRIVMEEDFGIEAHPCLNEPFWVARINEVHYIDFILKYC